MTISCYIVDDEFHAVEVLKDYIQRTPGLVLVGYATDPLNALNEIARAGAPMLTFLDIHMPELSGMEFAGLVNLYTNVIFTTSYPDFAVRAFEQDAFDYLLKPVSYERFLRSVQKMRKSLLKTSAAIPEPGGSFFIKTEIKGKLSRVVTDQVVYVESAQNYVRIHTAEQVYTTYLTMNEIQEFLPVDHFLRIHRSYIVNHSRIVTLEPGQVTLDNKVKLPVGPNYRETIAQKIESSLVQTKRKL